MHLAGVQSRARYLVFPWLIAPVFTIATILVDQWYKAAATIQNKFSKLKADQDQMPKKVKYAILTLVWGGNILVGTIVPMIVFDDPTQLNWAYVSNFSVVGFITVFYFYILVRTTWRLVQVCTPEHEGDLTEDLAGVLRKVKSFFLFFSTAASPHISSLSTPPLPHSSTPPLLHSLHYPLFCSLQLKIALFFFTSCVVYLIVEIVFPIWMAVTVTPSNPGMQGHFFFQYAFFNPSLGGIALMFVWLFRKASTSPAGSKVKNRSSSVEKDKVTTEEPPQGSFSFTMEELNGASAKPTPETV